MLTNCSDDDNYLPNNRFFTSTPAKNKTNINKTPPIFSTKVKKVKTMIINYNCVKGPSKQAAFLATLDIHKPDIVLGCKSKLCNSMCSFNFSITTTPSFVKIAMKMEVGSLLQHLIE